MIIARILKKGFSLGLGLNIALLATTCMAQGSGFSIDQAVIASGGGLTSDGTFSINGTIAQSAVGSEMLGGDFGVSPGFWTSPMFAPTAATVTISGRVLTPDGRGLNGAIVTCMDRLGNFQISRTGSLGYFLFLDIPVGETYFVSVESKRYVFAPRTVSVVDEITGLDFFPEE